MTAREISELAKWTAKSIQDAVREGGRELDDAGTDIIREYVKSSLLMWQRGEKISHENLSRLFNEIFLRRHQETKNEDEVMNAMLILGSKFPSFVEENQRQREAEAKILAAKMPTVKV
ncbi:MAG: hypothetical protein IJQ85_08600 [Selenomonadaceae bacterium]|nr:hypothetical protein [Selenomonadaceae bacterium]